MTYLVDTNVISEFMNPVPNPTMIKWWEREEPDSVFYISAVSIAEIQDGICRKAPGSRRRVLLEAWLKDAVIGAFEGRIIPFGLEEAQKWGEVMASEAARGRPKPDMDTQIAATALVHGLTVVTRNVSDFDIPHLKVVNPFDVCSRK